MGRLTKPAYKDGQQMVVALTLCSGCVQGGLFPRVGVDTFRAFVESWYRCGFQRIIFHADPPPLVRRMISAVLAGYAWDATNPYVRDAARRLAALEQLCCDR